MKPFLYTLQSLFVLAALVSGCHGAAPTEGTTPASPSAPDGAPEVPPAGDPGKPADPSTTETDAGGPPPAPVVREGDVIVRSLADLRDLAGVNVLHGALRVERADVLDLEPLGELREVRSLVIRDNGVLRSLHGLEALTRVEGDLLVAESPALTSLDGLAALAEVGGAVSIGNGQKAVIDPTTRALQGLVPATENAALVSAVLPALARAGSLAVLRNGALERIGFPALAQVEGDLEISFAPKLASLEGAFPALKSLGGTLTIGRAPAQVTYTEGGAARLLSVPAYGNDVLTTIRLPQLRLARSVLVTATGEAASFSAPALESLVEELTLVCPVARLDTILTVGGNVTLQGTRELSMPRLNRVHGGLTVLGVKLRSLDMLERLARIDSGIVVRYTELESLRLPQLLSAENITVSRNASLQSIALPTFERTSMYIEITANAALTRVELPKLVGTPIFALQSNPALETLSLPSLEDPLESLLIEAGKSLRSFEAPRLRKVDSFSLSAPNARTELALGALTEVGGLTLRDGPTSLAAFASLTRLSSLYVRTHNIAQADLDAFVSALRSRGVEVSDVNVRYTPAHP
jgi:hypothetical protein